MLPVVIDLVAEAVIHGDFVPRFWPLEVAFERAVDFLHLGPEYCPVLPVSVRGLERTHRLAISVSRRHKLPRVDHFFTVNNCFAPSGDNHAKVSPSCP
jgi:hypothetical protein